MRKLFYRYLTNLFRANNRIVILLGDIGVFSFRDAFEYDPTRIYNVGIMEQSMIGVAAGLADKGFIPFVHSIAPFVTERCVEQIKIDLAYESKNVFVVSVGNSYDYSRLGITHQCPNDLRILSAIPNLATYCPGNQTDIEEIVALSITRPFPKYIRLSEYANNFDKLATHKVLQSGDSSNIILVVGNAIKDIDILLAANIPATIFYTYNVSEFNPYSLMTNAVQSRRITVVEPCADSGIISKIAITIPNIKKLHSIAVPKSFIDRYGSKAELDEYLSLSDTKIIERLQGIYHA